MKRFACCLVATALATSAVAQRLQYPKTRAVEQVDVYHGVKVADPYRWLEDDNSPDTAAWIAEASAAGAACLQR